MSEKHFNVLFLCTGNSARSILAESILNREGAARFTAYSAGSKPTGKVHPLALALLEKRKFPTAGLRSKSWQEFAEAGAPKLDIVLTVCESAAAETCPVWPGAPISAHWGVPDPAAVEGSAMERALAFAGAFGMLSERIKRLCALPLGDLDDSAVRLALESIGQGSR